MRLFSLGVFIAFGLLAPLAWAEPVPETFLGSEDRKIEIYTLTNTHGLRARVMTWGATLIEMSVPDRAGNLGDVTLGFDSPGRYLEPHPFFGSVAGRYANRIAKGRFALDGHEYVLAVNNGPNHLHGGTRGFDKRIWTAQEATKESVTLRYLSPDGEEGYPGNLQVSVRYKLTEKDELKLLYTGVTDRTTVVNLTNHTYWNLAGQGDVLNHEVQIAAKRYTPTDPTLIPSGRVQEVAGTPLDFRVSKKIGRDLAALKEPDGPGGYDHNFVLDGGGSEIPPFAAEVRETGTGRVMRVRTTQPGLQLYTANGMKGVAGRGGAIYGSFAGLCLETQHFPDSPNHPEFPTTTLKPGEVFVSETVYAFSTD